VQYGTVHSTPLTLSRARYADKPYILDLIQEAARWLRVKDTDQWARPWPDQAGLDARISSALRQGMTWMCWDGEFPAATITADSQQDPYWSEANPAEAAVYIHRLVVSRKYAGLGLGSALLDWAGLVGRRESEARRIRLSAWTTNQSLHDYYRRQGFAFVGLHPDPDYPSRARFQKPTDNLSLSGLVPFRQA
jgi:ribosomal protein S18 acetylase RimI-like enzyme